eukprot:4403035-Prymnesium_polylepis.1
MDADCACELEMGGTQITTISITKRKMAAQRQCRRSAIARCLGGSIRELESCDKEASAARHPAHGQPREVRSLIRTALAA